MDLCFLCNREFEATVAGHDEHFKSFHNDFLELTTRIRQCYANNDYEAAEPLLEKLALVQAKYQDPEFDASQFEFRRL